MKIDQQCALFLFISWLTFPLRGKWRDFVEEKLYSQSIIFCFKLVKIIEFKFLTNKDKFTEIVPPLLLTPCAMVRAKKGQHKVQILKKTTGLCLSRSYFSMIPTWACWGTVVILHILCRGGTPTASMTSIDTKWKSNFPQVYDKSKGWNKSHTVSRDFYPPILFAKLTHFGTLIDMSFSIMASILCRFSIRTEGSF